MAATGTKSGVVGVGSVVHAVGGDGQCFVAAVASLGEEWGEVRLEGDGGWGRDEDGIVHYSDAKAVGTWHWPSLDD